METIYELLERHGEQCWKMEQEEPESQREGIKRNKEEAIFETRTTGVEGFSELLRAGIHRVCNKSEPGVNKEKPRLGTLMNV